ncbi:MAG TPA: anti-sigma factor RsbA family regulatory protein [Streptosporangiaceae bacterium]|nr:anti-sigma factor RsbA family regulatory protein [Streptosporangiaceae bacterium]
MTAGQGTSLIHRALVYSGEREFLAAAVPFLRAGLTADDVVLVAASPPRLDRVRRALGAAAEPVLFLDVAEWYRHPVRTIAAYDQFLRAQAPRRVRALAELDWADRRRREAREWARYEAVVNEVFGTSGARALCAYDRHATAPGMLAEVRRTHRELVEDGRPRSSADYTDPGRLFAEFDREPLPLPPPPVFDSLPIESDDLHEVRAFVAARAARHGLPGRALSALLVAVTELAANAVKHGTPPMAVRLWADGPDLVCEVADCGLWRPDALLGFVPPAAATSGGFGLWGVRMLADAVQVRAGWDGTVVRLRMRLTG